MELVALGVTRCKGGGVRLAHAVGGWKSELIEQYLFSAPTPSGVVPELVDCSNVLRAYVCWALGWDLPGHLELNRVMTGDVFR